MMLLQNRQQFLTAPGGMALARLKNRGHDVLRGLIGRAARFKGTLVQTGGSVSKIAVNPFITALTTDLVERAERRY